MTTATQTDLSKYDIMLLIDKSGSMGTVDAHGKSRWFAAQEATEAQARTVAGP